MVENYLSCILFLAPQYDTIELGIGFKNDSENEMFSQGILQVKESVLFIGNFGSATQWSSAEIP